MRNTLAFGLVIVVVFVSRTCLALNLTSIEGLLTGRWTVIENKKYGQTDQETADLVLLRGKKNPAIVFIHGGGWVYGDKTGYGYYARKYARAGISSIAINYRLAREGEPSTQWPAQLQDVQAAVRWVRANAHKFGIDPDRICAMGDSAGGHLALFLGSVENSTPGDRSHLYSGYSPKVRCVVDMFGPTDFTKASFLKAIDRHVLFGGKSYALAPQLYEDASPVLKVNPRSSRTFIIQGLNDQIVPTEQALLMKEALQRNGVSVVYRDYDGDHWYKDINPSWMKKVIDDAALGFVVHSLKNLLLSSAVEQLNTY